MRGHSRLRFVEQVELDHRALSDDLVDPLAVVARWAVCELRTRALAHGLPCIGARTGAAAVCKELERAGRASTPLVARLHATRERRNAWLHSGAEPDESQAVEALQLAVELLRPMVPNLVVRPTSSLLIL
jgi:hypothetical protein